MSAQIRKERKAYYDFLEKTQHGTLDIMGWLEWFLDCLDRAFDGAETTVGNELHKARSGNTMLQACSMIASMEENFSSHRQAPSP